MLLSSATVRDLDRLTARVIDTPDRSEVMLLATARVRASRKAFLACASDPSCLRASGDLLGAGRLPADRT